MLTPNGQCAIKIEKVMLLAIWAYALQEECLQEKHPKKLIIAGIGKPTYPINAHTIASYLSYWQKINDVAKQWHLFPESTQESAAIDYGDPHGDYEPREIMAKAMSNWYDVAVRPEHILFTVGGIAALRVIFETFNARYSDTSRYRIITPFPHYSAYSNNQHRLHPIDVMSEPGYKLTASAMEASIKDAYQQAEIDHEWPKAVLICNPSNPLGNFVDEDELKKIAEVLRKYPELHIVFDEAYIEMCFEEMPLFLTIAPDLKDRTIIMRSATKALSAAGERMAMLIVFDPKLMSEMLNKNISYFVHAPRSSQIVYAQTMANFNVEEHEDLIKFYKKKVEYVVERINNMGASMPDPTHKIEATFYALADFSDLFGLELPPSVSRVLQKTGQVKTDEDLAYYLLFNDALMIAPLSYFGLPASHGYCRITCSGSEVELIDLMDRLEHRLYETRKMQGIDLLNEVHKKLIEVKRLDAHMHETLTKKIPLFNYAQENSLSLKIKNKSLGEIHMMLVSFLKLMQ